MLVKIDHTLREEEKGGEGQAAGGAPAGEEATASEAGSEDTASQDTANQFETMDLEESVDEGAETTTDEGKAATAASTESETDKTGEEGKSPEAGGEGDTTEAGTTEAASEETQSKEGDTEQLGSQEAGRTQAQIGEEITQAQNYIENMLKVASEGREEIIGALANDYYTPLINDEMVEQLRTEPEKAIPKLLATVYTDAIQGITSVMVNNLPSLIDQVERQRTLNLEAENQFYHEFPDLKGKGLEEDIGRITRAYVTANPDTDLETRIRDIGVAIHMKHRIPLPDGTGAPAPGGNGGQPPPAKVSGGTDAGAAAKAKSGNQFSDLYTESEAAGDDF